VRCQGLLEIFRASIHRAHRALIFAIAQLSCYVYYYGYADTRSRNLCKKFIEVNLRKFFFSHKSLTPTRMQLYTVPRKFATRTCIDLHQTLTPVMCRSLLSCTSFWSVWRKTGCSKKTVPLFYFCDNFRKCAPILTIFSLVEQEMYDA